MDGPSSQVLFFGERGNVEFNDSLTFDLSLNYQIPIVKDFELWLKADVFNLFDDDTQIFERTDISPNFDGPTDSLGLPTTFTEGSRFGDPNSNASFVSPFEYQFTVGFRF